MWKEGTSHLSWRSNPRRAAERLDAQVRWLTVACPSRPPRDAERFAVPPLAGPGGDSGTQSWRAYVFVNEIRRGRAGKGNRRAWRPPRGPPRLPSVRATPPRPAPDPRPRLPPPLVSSRRGNWQEGATPALLLTTEQKDRILSGCPWTVAASAAWARGESHLDRPSGGDRFVRQQARWLVAACPTVAPRWKQHFEVAPEPNLAGGMADEGAADEGAADEGAGGGGPTPPSPAAAAAGAPPRDPGIRSWHAYNFVDKLKLHWVPESARAGRRPPRPLPPEAIEELMRGCAWFREATEAWARGESHLAAGRQLHAPAAVVKGEELGEVEDAGRGGRVGGVVGGGARGSGGTAMTLAAGGGGRGGPGRSAAGRGVKRPTPSGAGKWRRKRAAGSDSDDDGAWGESSGDDEKSAAAAAAVRRRPQREAARVRRRYRGVDESPNESPELDASAPPAESDGGGISSNDNDGEGLAPPGVHTDGKPSVGTDDDDDDDMAAAAVAGPRPVPPPSLPSLLPLLPDLATLPPLPFPPAGGGGAG